MARYSLFVLKVSLKPKQTNKQTLGDCWSQKGGSEPGTRSQFYSIGISSVLLAMSDWDEKPIRAL